MRDFFEILAENGHEIHVLLRTRDRKEKKIVQNGNMWFHYIKLPHVFKLHRLIALPAFLIKSIQICLKYNIDLTYSHIYGFHGLIGVIISKITGKLSVHWHCGFVDYFRQGMSILPLITDYYPLRLTAKFVDVLLTCTNATKRHYEKFWALNPNKMEVLPNSVSLDRFNPSISDTDLKRKLSLRKNIILFVHGLSERKGPQYLIRALPYILIKFPDSTCIIIGKGPQLAELIDLAKDLGLKNYFDVSLIC